MSTKEQVIEHLKKNEIDIDDLQIGSDIMGWKVKGGAFESYLESGEYLGLVESTIYQRDVE